MIAPNNHLPFRRTGFTDIGNMCRFKLKTEVNEICGKEEEEDRENRNKSRGSKDK